MILKEFIEKERKAIRLSWLKDVKSNIERMIVFILDESDEIDQIAIEKMNQLHTWLEDEIAKIEPAKTTESVSSVVEETKPMEAEIPPMSDSGQNQASDSTIPSPDQGQAAG